jgi:SAM-dependent methyltransferase
MNWIERVHDSRVHVRRVNILSSRLAGLIPANARVLDIGSGDGWICARLAELRRDLEIIAVDTLVRRDTRFPVVAYDGLHLPYETGSFDAIVLVDVLHHVPHDRSLLAEVLRVTRRHVVIKDHLCESALDRWVLRKMDRVGNEHLGVESVFAYKSRREWDRLFVDLGLAIRQWVPRLSLYPPVVGWVFERRLHFMALLEKQEG